MTNNSTITPEHKSGSQRSVARPPTSHQAARGYVESFNARLRDELLDGEIFYTLPEARIVIESWRRHYKRASQHPSVYVIEAKRLC